MGRDELDSPIQSLTEAIDEVCGRTPGFVNLPQRLDYYRRTDRSSAEIAAELERKAANKAAKKRAVRRRRADMVARNEGQILRDRRILEMLARGDEYVCSHPECDIRQALSLDHITPLSEGGSDELDNLRFMCKSHNTKAWLSYYWGRKKRPRASLE